MGIMFLKLKLLLVGPIEEKIRFQNIPRSKYPDSSIYSRTLLKMLLHIFFVNGRFVLPTYREGFPTVSLEASCYEFASSDYKSYRV
jgi:hypothetical protein